MIMKKIMTLSLVGIFLLVIPASADAACGSAFGTLTTGQVLGQGRGNFGLAVGVADATSFVGTFSYGLSTYSDGRIKLGLMDPDGPGDAKMVLGVDYKWQFWSFGPQTKHPFDFAVGGFFEYVDFDGLSIFQLGGQLIASYPISLKNGKTLTPYGRVNARMESLSFDLPAWASADDSESNLEVGLNAGVKWDMTPTVSLFGEFQLDGNDGLFLGIDFNIM